MCSQQHAQPMRTTEAPGPAISAARAATAAAYGVPYCMWAAPAGVHVLRFMAAAPAPYVLTLTACGHDLMVCGVFQCLTLAQSATNADLRYVVLLLLAAACHCCCLLLLPRLLAFCQPVVKVTAVECEAKLKTRKVRRGGDGRPGGDLRQHARVSSHGTVAGVWGVGGAARQVHEFGRGVEGAEGHRLRATGLVGCCNMCWWLTAGCGQGAQVGACVGMSVGWGQLGSVCGLLLCTHMPGCVLRDARGRGGMYSNETCCCRQHFCASKTAFRSHVSAEAGL
jgi:hypothetical protein